jgi:hypothetical protein
MTKWRGLCKRRRRRAGSRGLDRRCGEALSSRPLARQLFRRSDEHVADVVSRKPEIPSSWWEKNRGSAGWQVHPVYPVKSRTVARFILNLAVTDMTRHDERAGERFLFRKNGTHRFQIHRRVDRRERARVA